MSGKLNNIKNRFLPIPENVSKGLESEPKITDFIILKELGSGSKGRTYLVQHKVTKAEYAIKAIDKRDRKNFDENFKEKVELIYKIHHPNITKLFSFFEDNNYCYFIMEYLSKGDVGFVFHIDKNKRLSSKCCSSIIKDIISAIYYLHNINPPIIHGYIKPQNILLSDGFVAKLTDFLNNYIPEEDYGRKAIGINNLRMQMQYLSPEIIEGKKYYKDKGDDIWSIGVLLFMLVTSKIPFQGDDYDSIKENILKLKICWPKNINSDAKDLIVKILKPEKRLSLEEMIKHPFITKNFPDAHKYLIKPEQSSSYKPFIICKDDPKTWNPEIL